MSGCEWWQRLSKSRAQQRAARVGLHALTTPELAYVEDGIRPVVDVLNRFGFTTIASCEGHPWRAMRPYVMFKAPVGTAGQIERFFREEEVNAASELRSSWFVVPAFDTRYELAFSIVGRGGVAEPTLAGLFSSPRTHLDRELRRLAGKLEAVLRHARVQEALKSFRWENEVGVIKIKMSASEFAAYRAAYSAAASVPFRTETVYLAHQPVQCGVKNPDTELETRIKSSQGYGKSTLGNDTDVTADGQVTPASSAQE